jgi:hypothetical protein
VNDRVEQLKARLAELGAGPVDLPIMAAIGFQLGLLHASQVARARAAEHMKAYDLDGCDEDYAGAIDFTVFAKELEALANLPEGHIAQKEASEKE